MNNEKFYNLSSKTALKGSIQKEFSRRICRAREFTRLLQVCLEIGHTFKDTGCVTQKHMEQKLGYGIREDVCVEH
jgi:hypothetical protein